MVTSFKRSHARTAALSAPDPAAGHHWHTHFCWKLLDTHGQVWVCLFWGHCSFLLTDGAHKVLFVPSKSLFPQSCVSSGICLVGLIATSSKRAYATSRSATPRVPAPTAVHCWPEPLQDTLKYNSDSVCGVSGSQCTQGFFEPPTVFGGYGVDSKCDLSPPSIVLGLLLCP